MFELTSRCEVKRVEKSVIFRIGEKFQIETQNEYANEKKRRDYCEID